MERDNNVLECSFWRPDSVKHFSKDYNTKYRGLVSMFINYFHVLNNEEMTTKEDHYDNQSLVSWLEWMNMYLPVDDTIY